MSREVQTLINAGIVSMVIAILTSVITLIINKKNLIHMQHESRRVGITEKRMTWITEVRNLFAELFSFDFNDFYIRKKKYKPFCKITQLILLYMNYGGKIDIEIINSINKLHEIVYEAVWYDEQHLSDYEDLKGDYERSINNLHKFISVYLKSEWNRVKFDSDPLNGNKTYDEDNEIIKLLEVYNKSKEFLNDDPVRRSETMRNSIMKGVI